MIQILAKYIPPTIYLHDFIHKSKRRDEFHKSDLPEVSRKILFKTPQGVHKTLTEMYDADIAVQVDHECDKLRVHIGGRFAFDVYGFTLGYNHEINSHRSS